MIEEIIDDIAIELKLAHNFYILTDSNWVESWKNWVWYVSAY